MKQVIRRGLKESIVDKVADPQAEAPRVPVRPLYSSIGSGTKKESGAAETINAGRDLKRAPDNVPFSDACFYDARRVGDERRAVSI